MIANSTDKAQIYINQAGIDASRGERERESDEIFGLPIALQGLAACVCLSGRKSFSQSLDEVMAQ
jgi:hypothetical protein